MNLIVWPIVVVLIIIVFIFLRKNMHKLIKPQHRKSFLVAYIVLLAIVAVVFFIVQPKALLVEVEPNEPVYVYDLLYDGAVEKLTPFLKNEWDIALTDGTIKLQVNAERFRYPEIPVLVIEDETKRDEAYVGFYETPTIIQTLDVSDIVMLPSAEIVDDHVFIEYSNTGQEYEFHMIKNVMTLNQFTDISRNYLFSDMSIGEVALIIKVPPETTVVSDMHHFHLIRQ